MRQPIKKLQKTTGLVGRLFVLFTSSCDPILLSLGAASHAVGVLWNDAATGRNSCFTRVTWVRRTKWANMFRFCAGCGIRFEPAKPPNPLTPFQLNSSVSCLRSQTLCFASTHPLHFFLLPPLNFHRPPIHH